MTVTAVIPLIGMRLMAELDVTGTGGQFISDRTRNSRMALYTIGFHTESCFVIMATAAGLPLLHLAHGEVFVTGARDEEIRMAILAAIGGNVECMTEFGAAGAKMNLFDSMTFLAVGFYTKSGLAIMAGTTRTTFFHSSHAGPYTFFSGLENLIMAFNTFVHALMYGMAECCIARFFDFKNNINSRFVTLITISFNTENGRTIMAAAAGRTIFHLCHGKTLVIRTGAIQLTMTISAGVNGEMLIMVKAGIIRKQNFLDGMALTA